MGGRPPASPAGFHPGGIIQTERQSPGFVLTKKDGEFLRILASVSVVIAHCIHFWVEEYYRVRSVASVPFFCTVLDQFTRFTVPLFFFLSGFGLTLQFRDKPLNLAKYYKFRLNKILAPFLLWSGITAFRHVDLFQSMPWGSDPRGSTLGLLRMLLLDGFDYQYYFLIVIFQFYLVYPFLYKLGKSRLWIWIFLAVHLCLLSPVETYLELLGLELPKLHANLLFFHWFNCFAGVYAAWHKDFLLDLVRRWSPAKITGFWILTVLLMNLEFHVNILNEKLLFDVDHFNRWSVLLYCLASLLLFMRAKNFIAARIYANPRFNFLFTHMAPYTFFVYLVHTHVLRTVDFLFWELTVFDLLNRIILVVAGSYFVAWLAQWLLEDFPRLRFYFGLPKKPIMEWSGVPGFGRFKLRPSKQGMPSLLQPRREPPARNRVFDVSSER